MDNLEMEQQIRKEAKAMDSSTKEEKELCSFCPGTHNNLRRMGLCAFSS